MNKARKQAHSKSAKISSEIRRIKGQVIEAIQTGDMERAQKLTALLPRREARPGVLGVPVTAAMKQAAHLAAEAQGLTVSEWLRGLIAQATTPIPAMDLGSINRGYVEGTKGNGSARW